MKNANLGAFYINVSVVYKVFVVFFLILHQTLSLHAFCIKSKDGKISMSDKNHGLTPLEKRKLWGSFKSIIKKASFFSRTSPIAFSLYVFHKRHS